MTTLVIINIGVIAILMLTVLIIGTRTLILDEMILIIGNRISTFTIDQTNISVIIILSRHHHPT